MSIIGDVIFAAAILAAIFFLHYRREKNASIQELSDVKYWYSRGYLTKEEVETAIGPDGNMALKTYKELKAKVDKQRLLKTLTGETNENHARKGTKG
jgi:hypothetical protein